MYDWKKNQGITLLELLFTVAIIGIILLRRCPVLKP
ncbi:prepilin-type N-terminal cleavage/methylation domain-containing protein [Photobacterium swingsii]